MSKSKYVAVSEFLDGKRNHVKMGSPISETDYDDVTIKHYLNIACIAERAEQQKAKNPTKNKAAKPSKNK